MTALFLTLLNMSIAAGWSILAVLLLRLCLRKAPKWITCLLWVIPALRLLIPGFLESGFSLIPSPEVIPTDIVQAETPIIYSGFSEINSTVNPLLTQQADSLDQLLQVSAIIWAVGFGIMLLCSFISWLRLHFMVRASMQYRDRIYLCDDVKSPFIFGILRPRIYLPSGLEEETLRHVVAHETSHLKRLDHLWKPLGYLLLSIYWFNPLLWVAYILLCRDIERACDEQVLRSIDETGRHRYAKALMDCSTHRRMILTCPVAFGEVGVKARIKAVLSYKKPAFWVVLVALLICTATSVCFLTNPKPCLHTYRSEVTLSATCTQKGLDTMTCTKCGHAYAVNTPLCAHNYDEGVVLQASDCATQGAEELTCLDCGEVTVRSLPLTPDIHDLQETVVKAPACGTPGVGNTTCSRCGYLHAYEIAALEHQYELTEKIKANCLHVGQEVYTCKFCGLKEVKELPKTDHYGGAFCLVCGAPFQCVPPFPLFSESNSSSNPQSKQTPISEIKNEPNPIISPLFPFP